MLTAIMQALDAYQSMSNQVLGSEPVCDRLHNILLGPAQLYEALRCKPEHRAR